MVEFLPSVPVHRLTRNLHLNSACQDYGTGIPPLASLGIKLWMQKRARKSGKGLFFMRVGQQISQLTVCSFKLVPPSKGTQVSHQGHRFGAKSMNRCCFPSVTASSSWECYGVAAWGAEEWQGHARHPHRLKTRLLLAWSWPCHLPK